MNKGYVIVDYTTGETIGIFISWQDAYEFCSNFENHKVMIAPIADYGDFVKAIDKSNTIWYTGT